VDEEVRISISLKIRRDVDCFRRGGDSAKKSNNLLE